MIVLSDSSFVDRSVDDDAVVEAVHARAQAERADVLAPRHEA